MKLVSRIIAAILFVIFFGLALKNTQEVVLYFFWNQVSAPLVLLLLAFFAAGSVLGILAMIPMTFRNRRELSKHKKMITAMEEAQEAQRLARTQAPSADTISKDTIL